LSNLAYNNPIDDSIDLSNDTSTVRAYLFSDTTQNAHVIALKGTSTLLGKAHPVDNLKVDISNDKKNDNMFFGCCFHKQTPLFPCNCSFKEKKMCCKSCFEKSLKYKLNYFVIGKQILHDVNRLIDFNNSKVILTGHSLGGALATMLGLVFDKTAVSFESPGERNYMEKAGISYKKSAEQNIMQTLFLPESAMDGSVGVEQVGIL
jgi:lipase ATG15